MYFGSFTLTLVGPAPRPLKHQGNSCSVKMGTLGSFTEFTGIVGCCWGEIVPATPVVWLIYDLVTLYFLEQLKQCLELRRVSLFLPCLTVQMIFSLITVCNTRRDSDKALITYT